jgi:hypothetical protein
MKDFTPLPFFPPHLMDLMIRSFTTATPLHSQQNVIEIARAKYGTIYTPLIAIEKTTLTKSHHFAPLDKYRNDVNGLKLMKVSRKVPIALSLTLFEFQELFYQAEEGPLKNVKHTIPLEHLCDAKLLGNKWVTTLLSRGVVVSGLIGR